MFDACVRMIGISFVSGVIDEDLEDPARPGEPRECGFWLEPNRESPLRCAC
jgi:hypothetical protein